MLLFMIHATVLYAIVLLYNFPCLHLFRFHFLHLSYIFYLIVYRFVSADISFISSYNNRLSLHYYSVIAHTQSFIHRNSCHVALPLRGCMTQCTLSSVRLSVSPLISVRPSHAWK